MKKPLLVTLADKNYLEYAKQIFASAYFNAGWKGDCMLLTHNISERDLKWFRQKGIKIYHCDPIILQKTIGSKKIVTYSRFYLFKEKFKCWSHVIYFDVDIIIRASLDNLLKVKSFAVAPPIVGSKLSDYFNNSKKLLDYDLSSEVFCDGFFVFNTNIISSTTFNDLIDLVKKFEPLAKKNCDDQGFMNLFFYQKWEKLSPIYHIYIENGKNQWRIANQDIQGIVIHLIGGKKPWERNSDFFNEWQSNYLKTDLIDLKKISVGNKWSHMKILFHSHYLNFKASTWYDYVWQKYFKLLKFVEKNFPQFFKMLKRAKLKICRGV
ncbi:MAG: glycosyltransferase [Patescibacteria group bacterium]|jgi:lipopolysaccharide biosynthesis glycosyltransferase